MSDKAKTVFWGRQINEVLSGIVREAAICRVNLLEPGVIDAIVKNQDSICGNNNPMAFKKLRDLVLMGMMVKGKSVERLGPLETDTLIEAFVEKIRQHQGGAAR